MRHHLTFLFVLICGWLAAQQNLLRNPSFEDAKLSDTYIRNRLRPDGAEQSRKARPNEIDCRIDDSRAHDGSQALLIENRAGKGSSEINFNRLPFLGQVKHRFRGYYYIAEHLSEGVRVAGRITFFDENKEILKHLFPEFAIETGRWHEVCQDFYPPLGTARVMVTLWFIGGMRAWLDDLYFGEVLDPAIPERHAGAQLLSHNNDLTIWSERPYFKVPRQGVPEGLASSDTISLSAAGGEREPFQLVLSARRAQAGVSLRFTALRHQLDPATSIPPEACDYRIVDYIYLTEPDNPLLKGWQADPLLAERQLKIEADNNAPFYAWVQVPADQKPGIYGGKIEVWGEEALLATVNLSVRVFAFTIPTSSAFKSYFYTKPFPAYLGNDPRPRSEIVENMQELLRDHRMIGNQAIGLPRPTWEVRDGELVITDWTAFDKAVERWSRDYGLRCFPASGLWMMGDNNGWFSKNRLVEEVKFGAYPVLSEGGLRYLGQYAQKFTAHVKRKFPDLEFFAYVYDEPPAKVYKELRVILNNLHSYAPDLKIFIPKTVNDEIGYVHAWCVPFSPGYLHLEKQAAEMAQGKQIWYYNWPVRLDDFSYIRNRLFTWQIYAADGVGGLLWNTVHTRSGINPWKRLEKTYGCGAASIFYPPREAGERMVASLRAAQIREGIDDFDYFVLLQTALDKNFPGLGRQRVKELLSGILPDLSFTFHNHPHLLYQLRQRFGEEIELALHGPPQLLLSNPPEYSRSEVSEINWQFHAPPGTQLTTADGKKHTVGESGMLEIQGHLERLGYNQLKLQVSAAQTGETVELTRSYTLLPDPKLRQLQAASEKLQAATLENKELTAFLDKLAKTESYTGETRAEVALWLNKAESALLAAQLQRLLAMKHNSLSTPLAERAKWAFDEQLFARSAYYLALAEKAVAAERDPSSGAVSVQALEISGHLAFVLSNSRVKATILETGGRIISLRIDGVETLVQNSFAGGLPALQRARQEADAGLVTKLRSYGGFEDAGPKSLWPISFVDWDIELISLAADAVSIQASIKLPDRPFFISRKMSLAADSNELLLDYQIDNLTPAEFASDDPAHFQLGWRARLLPGIGADGTRNDQLVLPVDNDLPATLCDPEQNSLQFEMRQLRLRDRQMGSYDVNSGYGLALLLDPIMTHAYVWFQTNTAKPIYTLEIPRNFFGKSALDPEANRPLTIKAGESCHFQLRLRGVSGIKNADDWQKAVAEHKKK